MDSILLERVEKFLLRNGKLFFKDYTPKVKAPLNTFYNSLESLKDKYITISETDFYAKTLTHRSRSLRDQFLLCAYYTNCTLLDFLKVVNSYGVAGIWCGDVHLWILYNKARHDSFLLFDSNYPLLELDGISIRELFNAAEINLEEGEN